MEGVRVKLRVSGLEPESRVPGSSQRLLRASTMTALITHPGSWPLVCPQRHSPPPSEAGLAQAGLGLGYRVSSARLPPTLGLLPQLSRFLSLFLGLISLPCCICSLDTPHLEVLLHLPALEPCQSFWRCWLGKKRKLWAEGVI